MRLQRGGEQAIVRRIREHGLVHSGVGGEFGQRAKPYVPYRGLWLGMERVERNHNILMAMTGGTVGKSYLVESLIEPMVVNQRVATINVLESANPRYIDIVIRSEMTQEVIRKAKNSTNDNISMGDIKGFAIPVPPLAEQRRIVAKVEQLLGQVDKLETQLAASRATAANLLSAVVAELTSVSSSPSAGSS